MIALFRAATAALMLLALMPAAAMADDGLLTIEGASGSHSFTVEVVDTPDARAKGLMYRRQLAPDAGMLFIFEQTRPVSFWMRNTLIPLDMIFIREDGEVASVHAMAQPLDETAIPSDGAVRYVLEIPGGRAEELGIVAGDRVTHPRIPAAG